MKRFCFVLLCLSAALSAKIIQTSDFTEVLDWIEGDTLVVLDIENTLVRPAQWLGSTPWGWSHVDQLQGEGYTREQAMARTRQIMKRVVQHTEYVPVQEEIPAVVRQLQARGLEVMGLSNRPPAWGFATADALAALEIDLMGSAPVQGTFVMPGREELQFIEGTLYVRDMGDKGAALVDFLEIAGRRPTRVVVVDDRRRNIELVSAELAAAGIECIGLHYTGANGWRRHYDADVAAIQLKHFGTILSNEDAEKLLAEGIER